MNFADDIPLSVAQAAHNGTSFVPERRAEQERNGYAQDMQNAWDHLAQFADTDDKRATLAEEFERFRAGYRKRKLAYLHSSSRIVSTMIAGPSNFPAARMNKRADIAHKRLTELLEFRERALKAIRRTLQPELRPIMSGDSNATERLQAKIAEAEALQANMKAVNDAHKRFLKNPASLDSAPFSDAMKDKIRAYKPAYSWEPHPFAPYELSNNNANIRRMKERLAQVSKAQETPDSAKDGANARIEDCPSENRVRLFFPGKPAVEVRDKLKKTGFRWAPSLGCWQAFRNYRSIELAKEIAG